MLIAKARGNNFEAKALAEQFKAEFGKNEALIERYYDQANTFYAVNRLCDQGKSSIILE